MKKILIIEVEETKDHTFIEAKHCIKLWCRDAGFTVKVEAYTKEGN